MISLVVVASIVLYSIACEVVPQHVTRYNSHAWSSMLRWNMGKESVLLQTVLYKVFHASDIGETSHLTLLVDMFTWFVLFVSSSVLATLVLVCFMIVQAHSYGTNAVICAVFLLWTVWMAYIASLTEHNTSSYLVGLLCITSIIRVIGHAVGEATPPIIFDGTKPQGKFKTTMVTLKGWIDYIRHNGYGDKLPWSSLIWSPIVGILSELQAGLPFRLMPIVMLKYMPGWKTTAFTQKQVDDACDLIRQHGWNGWPLTRQLYDGMISTVVTEDTKYYD